MTKIRVLVVDDSAVARKVLTEMLGRDRGIEVAGTAPNAHHAWRKLATLDPDVVTLDVEMPGMNGLEFLERLMRLRPTPVVMVSSLTRNGADATLRALELGAVDFVAKSRVGVSVDFETMARELVEKVKLAATVRLSALGEPPPSSGDREPPPVAVGDTEPSRVIAIGASTGGPVALKAVLRSLPPDTPGVVVVQHIPAQFTESLARRLNQESPMRVQAVEDGAEIRRGSVLLAGGDAHVVVERSGSRLACRIHRDPPVNWHRPSVEVLFRSVAQSAGPGAAGVLLTGMGSDGAHGLLAMRQAGALTIAQDEETSVVWGMPGRAVALGAAQVVLPLEHIARRLAVGRPRRAA